MATSRERATLPPSPLADPPIPPGPVLDTMDLPHGFRATLYGHPRPTGVSHRNPAERP